MKIGIIGAGASGMMAAVTAAERGGEVTVFEKNDRVGRKLLATGNGKCNLGNLDFDMDKYYCDDKEKLKRIFAKFSPKDTIAFFERNGMLVKSKNGYLYPYSEQASTILDIFRKLLSLYQVEAVTEAKITDVFYHKKKDCFVVESEGKRRAFDRLVLSCGGSASLKRNEKFNGFLLAEQFHHTIKPIVPGLVQLRAKDAFLKGMAGVRIQAGLTLYIDGKEAARENGELQLTDYGISGIPVFQFSRKAGYAFLKGSSVTVKINFFPDYAEEAFKEMIRRRFERMQEETVEEFLLGMVNKKINIALMKYAGMPPDEKIKKLSFHRVTGFLSLYRKLTVQIDSVNGMENAQVCAGGVDFKEVDEGMQSFKQKGLYLTGELLDVDGKCGGYNLQWAWTSGYVAGRSACQ